MIPALVPMDVGMTILIIFIVLLVIAAIIGFSLVGAYNGLVSMRNRVQESWNQVDVELQRRHDLIPNLVNTVKGIAGHERNTLEEVVRLRNQAAGVRGAGAPTAEKAQVEEQLTQAVHQMLVTVEAYPELRSSANFQALQQELSDTEDRIANGRRYYNANVRAYNTKVESFPTSFIANMFKFEKATYFEVTNLEVRQAQNVDFSDMSSVGPTQSQQEARQSGQAAIAPSYQDAYPYPPSENTPQTGPFSQQPAPAPAPGQNFGDGYGQNPGGQTQPPANPPQR